MRDQDRDMFMNPETNYIRSLDDEIKRVLYEPNVHPDIKYKKYIHSLNYDLWFNVRDNLCLDKCASAERNNFKY